MTAQNDSIRPVDPVSQERLRAAGLEYRLIDNASDADLDAFLRADARGFLDEEPGDAKLAQQRATMRHRRNVGVFDASAGSWPVATANSWVTPLRVPGAEVDMWAISAVTVAGTHRRRGIARNLLEGELRAACAAGVPVAGLTVSEATIYGRYGFASALPALRFTVETQRAGWSGAPVPGRLRYVDRPTLADDLERLHEEARSARSGQIAGWRGRWERMAGTVEGDKEAAGVRGVRYLDADGVVRGALAYTLTQLPTGFRAELRVRTLITTTDDALRALWQFIVQHDLVVKAVADLRPLDDPLPWLVVDQRGITAEVHDHGWLRILDVAAALGGRRYSAPLDVVLDVDDPLGLTAGRWRVQVDAAGAATVSRTPDADGDAIALGIAELSAIYPGAVPAGQLAAAGRIRGAASAVDALTRAFRTEPAPLLGIWY